MKRAIAESKRVKKGRDWSPMPTDAPGFASKDHVVKDSDDEPLAKPAPRGRGAERGWLSALRLRLQRERISSHLLHCSRRSVVSADSLAAMHQLRGAVVRQPARA